MFERLLIRYYLCSVFCGLIFYLPILVALFLFSIAQLPLTITSSACGSNRRPDTVGNININININTDDHDVEHAYDEKDIIKYGDLEEDLVELTVNSNNIGDD